MAEKAEEWVERVFAKKFQKIPVAKGHDKKGKAIFERVVTENILIQQLGGASITVSVVTFVKMFRKVIESRKNKTDLQKAMAIAADEKRGYGGFVEACKKEGMFK